MPTATKIYFVNGCLSIILTDRRLATLEEYKDGERSPGTIFEGLRPWQKIELSEGIFELDLDLDPIEILRSTNPQVKELEEKLKQVHEALDNAESYELMTARESLAFTEEWEEVQELQEKLNLAQKILEQRPEYKEVKKWEEIVRELTAEMVQDYKDLEIARANTVRAEILAYFEVRTEHDTGAMDRQWRADCSDCQWVLAPKDSPQFKQVVEWSSEFQYVCSEEGRTFSDSWVLAASYDENSLWEKAERAWQAGDYEPLTTVREAVGNTPNGWLQGIIGRTVGSQWAVPFDLEKFLKLNWQRYDAGVNTIEGYRYYQALTENVIGYQRAGFLFDFEEKDLDKIELVDGKHGKELVSDLIQIQPARQAYLIIGNGQELGVNKDIIVTAHPGVFATSINAMDMADHTVQELYTYSCTHNTPFIVKAR